MAKEVQQSIFEPKAHHTFSEVEDVLMNENDKELKNELRHLMWYDAGILRDPEHLEKAKKRVETMLTLPIGKLLKLRLLVSLEIITSALNRKESLGAHYVQQGNDQCES